MAPRSDLLKYLEEDVEAISKRYDELWGKEDPEDNPYKSKYEARVLLEDAVTKIEELVTQQPTIDDAETGRVTIARLQLYLGKNYYYCEEVPAGERLFNKSLERYLRSPRRLEPKVFCYIQDCLNHLGLLWCGRQSHAEGMNFLRRAQIMFLNRPEAVKKECEEQADSNYTLTMFYLAQAYGGLGKGSLSARFCCETLCRQLIHNTGGGRSQEAVEKDPFDCKDWVKNLCGLSDYFTNECMFWTAEYILQSAAYMCDKCVEICGIAPESLDELRNECVRDLGIFYSTRLKFAKTCAENPALCEEVWRGEKTRSADEKSEEEKKGSKLVFQTKQADGAGAIEWDSIFPEVVFLEDVEAQDASFAEETIVLDAVETDKPSAEGRSSSTWLELKPGERVRLPVYFARLHEGVERRMRRANLQFLEVRGSLDDLSGWIDTSKDEDATPDVSKAQMRRPSCAGLSFEAAREIFKLANHYMVKSLSYFLLDGWVTEHVRILQEMSQMYRTILYWEQDHRRVGAMCARRIRMLGPLLEQLNPRVYIAFWRQLSFEVAEVFQEMFELKSYGKLPGHRVRGSAADDDSDDEIKSSGVSPAKAARCNELAIKTIKFYETFIESYHIDGKVPDRVETESCRVYLTARLNRARVRTKMVGLSIDKQLEQHKLALREYEWIQAYGVRNPEVVEKPDIGMAIEMKLCDEMVGMLPSKLGRIASKRR